MKLQWITGFSLVALLLVSCTSNRKVSTAPTPKPSVASAPAPPNPPTSDNSQQVARVPDLIESTDPATLPISPGRPDPFQAVTPPPIKLPVPPDQTQRNKTESDKSQTNKTQPDKSQTKTQTDRTQPNTNQTSKSQSNKTQSNTDQTNKTQANKTQTNKPQANKTQPNKIQPNRSQTNKTQTNKPQANTNQPNKIQPNITQPNKIQPNTNQPNKIQPNTNQPNKIQPNTTQPNKIQPNTTQINKTQPEKIQTEPSIELAKAVEVNGVMQVGGKLSAIVRTPDEKTSRYVSAGEYISNGAVLVKRIELGVNREPMVTLEQNGVEVIKQVGSTNGPVASLQ
jgi:Tfp pilus assembly protein PilP